MHGTQPQPIPAAVLAASGAADKVAMAHGVPTKALVEVRGTPVVRHVAQVLAAASLVSSVTVVKGAGSPVGEVVSDLAQVVEAGGPSILDTIDAAVAANPGAERLLLVTCDLPLLTAEHVDDFASRALPAGADMSYVIVSRETMTSKLPCATRTFVGLRGGYWTGGNLFCVSPAFLERERARIGTVFAARKSKLGMARLLGAGFIVSYALRLMTVQDVVKHAERLLNCRLNVVQSEHPEVAFDIDTPEQVLICRERAEQLAASS